MNEIKNLSKMIESRKRWGKLRIKEKMRLAKTSIEIKYRKIDELDGKWSLKKNEIKIKDRFSEVYNNIDPGVDEV